ncbi:dynein axonemal heavy chain 10 [Bacillus rossius redtenbacheri]|uniref:dynein axonemal heavy chain 10 n=1 Tax=Bacillus rossius redtenbacheri TaxID=93214 RepID=UPI002FDDCF36
MTDLRLTWLRQRLLSLVDESDVELFENMLNQDDRSLRNQMEAFFDDTAQSNEDIHSKVFFLYKTYYDKMVQEEILVPQEVIKTAPTAKLSESESDSATPTPRSGKKKKKKRGGSGKKEKVGSPRGGHDKVKKEKVGSPKGGREEKGKKRGKKGKGAKKEAAEQGSPRTEDEGFAESGPDADAKDVSAASPEVADDHAAPDGQEAPESQVAPDLDVHNAEEDADLETGKMASDLEGPSGGEESTNPASSMTAEDLSSHSAAEEDKGSAKGHKKKKKKKKTSKDDGSSKKGSGKRKTSPKSKRKGRKSPRTLVELVTDPSQSPTELDEQETEVSYVKKVVEKVIQAPMLNGFFGAMEESKVDPSQRYVYVLRSSGLRVPYQESWEKAVEELPQHFIFGSCRGHLLSFVRNFLRQVSVPLVTAQFREPLFSRLQSRQEDRARPPQEQRGRRASSRASLYKPSDFFILAQMIEREERHIPVASPDSCSLADCPMKSDLVSSINKFLNSAEWALKHTQENIILTVPAIPQLFDPSQDLQALAKDAALIKELEQVVMTWEDHISETIDENMRKRPLGPYPMDEFELWHEKEGSLSGLVEQLKNPSIQRILTVLNMSDSQIPQGFQHFEDLLIKHYEEARDNVKFLHTVIRHFKTLFEAQSFQEIGEVIPTLMEGLHMIWMLSRFYSTDEMMTGLMKRVAYTLCYQVSTNLNVNQLLVNQDLRSALKVISEASKMLETWKKSYMDIRRMIEESGKGQRWEFDRKQLFQTTDYMQRVCDQLYEVLKVTLNFENIFGPELKAIVTFTSQIDTAAKKVKDLVQPILSADFDIFLEENEEMWQGLVTQFNKQVEVLEKEAMWFIDDSFKILRSSEDALQMLMKFKNVETQPMLKNQLQTKFEVIMGRFCQEIAQIEDKFEKGKSSPPLLRNHPPMAGAIFWCQALFNQLKKLVLDFQDAEELKDSKLKEEAFVRYLKLGKQMKAFEKEKYDGWKKQALKAIDATMNKPVLKVVKYDREREVKVFQKALTRKDSVWASARVKTPQKAEHPSLQLDKRSSTGSRRSKVSSVASLPPLTSLRGAPPMTMSSVAMAMKWVGKGKAARLSQKVSSSSLLSASKSDSPPSLASEVVLVEENLRFQVNFDPAVSVIISEAELMEQLGFPLPAAVRNLCVQKDRLNSDLVACQTLVGNYNKLIDSLNIPELQFLRNHLLEVEKHIQSGLTRFSWNSLGVKEYAARCQQAFKNLVSFVKQVQKVTQDIRAQIESLGIFNLFYLHPPVSEPVRPNCKEFFAYMEKNRDEKMMQMVKIYGGVGPVLMKLEVLVLYTNTGTCPLMEMYYDYWEDKIFTTLVRLMLVNIKNFNSFLNGKVALFQVDTLLSDLEVVVRPTPLDIHNTIVGSVRNLFFVLKSLPRWMKGTCLECAPVKSRDSEELYVFSFLEDVVRTQAVNDMVVKIMDSVQKLISDILKYLQRWQKYRALWSFDKDAACDRFDSQKPTLVMYDEKLSYFGEVIETIEKIEKFHDVCCVRVNCVPLIDSIKEHCMGWKKCLAERLAANTKEKMEAFIMTMQELYDDVQQPIEALNSFKFVLQTITTIQKMSISAELTYNDICERYRTLRLHGVHADEEDEKLAAGLEEEWKALYLLALARMFSLEPTKERFAAMTRVEISDFVAYIKEFVERFNTEGPVAVGNDLDRGVTLIKEYQPEFIRLDDKRRDLQNAEVLFDIPPADYSDFLKALTQMENLEKLFDLYTRQKIAREEWAKTLWVNLNPKALQDGIDTFLREFRRLHADARQMLVGQVLDENMKDFKRTVPLFVQLKSEALRPRHWEELMNRTGQHFDMSADRFTLENMFAMELHRFEDIALQIINNAIKELTLEQQVKEIASQWTSMEFVVKKYSRGTEDRGFILGPLDEVVPVLEENSMSLQGMAGSQFIGPFLGLVQTWEKNLSLIGEVIDAWMEVQRRWMYLEGIFLSGDIRAQLPDEARKFDDIDKEFRKIMLLTAKNPNVKESCLHPGRMEVLMGLLDGLERCQKSLNEYLDSKRNAFPRFFFISDDELLSVLGSSDPGCIQEHMVKMFDNICSLRLGANDQNRKIASAMNSCEMEVMQFRQPVFTEGRVEEWMNTVLGEMRRTNRYITKKAIYDYGKVRRPRTEWMLDYQGMVCLAANQVWWTAEVENVFSLIKQGRKEAMKEYLLQLNRQLDELVLRVRSELTKNDRRKFNTVLIIDVHSRDIIENFVRDNVTNAQEFEWEIQLKFFWIKEVDNLIVKQCTGSFEYGYEYMGLNGRLVITPLTDRIYLTITQALSMHLGGAPAGPAGTGKTETTKDLAKALGLLCIVTNCGEGMDFRAVGKIFSGLCQCGAWGCFDEFNRIDISVLSVISTQLQTIRNALMLNVSRFNFEGQEIALDPKVGIFITMNPGYAGRTELPESVKALFRPVVCIVPDLELICQIMLFCEGFLDAKLLAKKMTVLYKQSKEQLSRQNHYDFGLRAIKSVLVMAGELKRSTPDYSEQLVLMRALRDMNLPKFVFDDVPLFLGLINDLFPGLDCPRVGYPDFNAAVTKALSDSGYIVLPEQVDKVVQLYETMMTRHSTMIVGPSGGGKTVVIQTLTKAQTILGLPTKLFTLNPKACSVIELYGILDPDTRDWTDGLLSNIFREINKPSDKEERLYILFDGDVDALWIENMNSVMDDNRLLTLSNGERIRLQPHCAMLFEVGDLRYASPATVSRAGMVYVDPKNLGYEPYWQRWLASRRSADERVLLAKLYEQYVPGMLSFIIDGLIGTMQLVPLETVVPQTDLNMVTQLCFMLDAMVPQPEDGEAGDPVSPELIESVFLQSLYCSLGASLLAEGRLLFDEQVKKQCGLLPFEDSRENMCRARNIPSTYPTLYDYYLDVEKKLWVAWSWMMPPYVHDFSRKFNEILVPTVDTVRTSWLLKVMNEVKRPVALVGETGTSKTAIIQDFLRQLDDTYMVLNINFSSRTNSMDVQRNLESSLEKRTKDMYGPPIGKKLICFIDDLNMPQVDTYGTQQPIALLKLLFEKGGFYDRGKDLNWKTVKDIGFFAAMGKAGGGRNAVDPRFISMFSVFNLIFPSDETLEHIYTSILAGHTQNFAPEIQALVSTIVDVTLKLYKVIIIDLPPTPSRFHYIFNLRDLSRICAGMCLTSSTYFTLPEQFVRVWRNEFVRVICDRLISYEDRDHMSQNIVEVVTSQFPEQAEYALRNPLLFGDYRNALREDEERLYEDLLDYQAISLLFKEILSEYNENQTLELVLFEDALDHLTRLHRVLRMHRGHMLIVGVGGCGKQSLTRLAAFTAGCTMFEISLSRGYNESSFKDDLKKLYYQLGVERKPTAFLFTDAQIVEDGFLELINNILTAGMVPALFAEDEKDQIVGDVRSAAVEAGTSVTKDAVWQFFIDTCTDNLHVVLAMSPMGDALRERCRNFPGLVNNTCVNWFFPWPEEALVAVAKEFLWDNPDIPEDHRIGIVKHVVYVHGTIRDYSLEFFLRLRRHNYVTPRHFLDFIASYLKLLKEKDNFIVTQCERLAGGLTKIAEASEELKVLNEKLAVQEVVLAEKTRACEKLLQDIEEGKKSATEKKQIATVSSIQIEEQRKVITVEKAEAEKALEEALPMLHQAKQALSELDKADITEIRSFSSPHEAVQVVGECVAILMGLKEISWRTAKGMMADPGFLKTLLEVKVDNISPAQIRAVKAHMKKTTKLGDMAGVSKAGFGLLKYVEAALGFWYAARDVKPKEQRVAFLMETLSDMERKLGQLNQEIENLEKTLSELEIQYRDAVESRQVLQDENDLMEKRLIAADKLLSGLGSESIRWEKDLANLKTEQKRLVGNCLLCSAFLSYTGPFSWEFRRRMVYDDWLEDIKTKAIPITLPFTLDEHLSDSVEISTWNSEGLPPDELSVQNGILTTQASRFPLCIDPQQQALTWIKRREAKNFLKTLSFSDRDFLRHLEIAVTNGIPVLFQDIDDSIDPVIDNVLQKNIQHQSGRIFVVLGDKEVDYNDKFRLYLTTKVSNPKFDPAVYAKATVINYTVTASGLEDQLLSVVVGHERADLESEREELIVQTSENKTLLKVLEDSLLMGLATTTGNMLDNVELVRTLDDTKEKAGEVMQKLEQAAKTAADIDKLREGYRPAAKRGAILFFVLSDLATVSPMYQYSLSAYLGVFTFSLDRANPDSILDRRLRNIISMLTTNFYNYGCTGIFEKHKLLFSFQMTIKLQQSIGKVKQEELDFFIKGNVSLEKSDKPSPGRWISSQGWEDIVKLSTDFPETFGALHNEISSHVDEWKQWYDLDVPELAELPRDYSTKVNKFELLMLLRCFRVDRIYMAVTNYIVDILGEQYITPPVISLNNIYEQSTPTTPVVFILSPGSDPTSDLMKLADSTGGGVKFRHLSLGQGQEEAAVRLLETAIVRGHWLMLQNCHLLLRFVRDLEKLLESIADPHQDFRLWLTTDPSPDFPIGILQRSLKVVMEPPNGLKLNLRSTFHKIPPDGLDRCYHPFYKPLVYVLAFFHAVVQERRKYEKIGWNINYDFNESDFNVCMDILDTYLTKALKANDPHIPWGSLKYLIGEVMYGGRVIDDFDRRIVQTYMEEYMGDFLFDEFQPFHFYHDQAIDYVIPQASNKEEYLRAIDALPLVNSPEVFGLHPNAEIGYFTQAVKSMWAYLVELQPQTGAVTGGISRDEFIDGVAKDILEKIPPLFDLAKVRRTFQANISPTVVVLLQELERFNKLMEHMKTSLDLLRKALVGEIGMDATLDKVAYSLFNGQLPEGWRRLSPATRKTLGGWMEHFKGRFAQYSAWCLSGEPMVIWLSGLHIPESYLTALVQMACRRNGWSLDRSTLYTSVSAFHHPEDVEQRPDVGCYAYGMFLEGARWDDENMCLARSHPKILIEELPILQITPVEVHRLRLQKTLRTPVYTTSDRRNAMGVGLVFEADLKTTVHNSHWILQGLCLTLNTD